MLFHCLLHIRTAGKMSDNFAPEQTVQQHIAGLLILITQRRDALFEKNMRFQTQSGCRRDGLTHMVRLRGALGNDNIRLFCLGIAQQKLKFAGFIAASGEACAIVSFYPDIWPLQQS